MINHKPKEVMIQIMKGANVDKETINAVKFFRCPVCTSTSTASSVAKVKAPSLYAFNFEVILDIFYVHDMNGDIF